MIAMAGLSGRGRPQQPARPRQPPRRLIGTRGLPTPQSCWAAPMRATAARRTRRWQSALRVARLPLTLTLTPTPTPTPTLTLALALAPTRSRLALARGPSASPRARARRRAVRRGLFLPARVPVRGGRRLRLRRARARPLPLGAVRGGELPTARTACARTASSEAAAGACMPTTASAPVTWCLQSTCQVWSHSASVPERGPRRQMRHARRRTLWLWVVGVLSVSRIRSCVACGAVDCRGLVVAPVAGRVEIKDKKLQL